MVVTVEEGQTPDKRHDQQLHHAPGSTALQHVYGQNTDNSYLERNFSSTDQGVFILYISNDPPPQKKTFGIYFFRSE